MLIREQRCSTSPKCASRVSSSNSCCIHEVADHKMGPRKQTKKDRARPTLVNLIFGVSSSDTPKSADPSLGNALRHSCHPVFCLRLGMAREVARTPPGEHHNHSHDTHVLKDPHCERTAPRWFELQFPLKSLSHLATDMNAYVYAHARASHLCVRVHRPILYT